MFDDDFDELENKLDTLLDSEFGLHEEYTRLKENESAMALERSELLRKNDVARTKVEAMINRLKSLDQSFK